jgi:hypothetical protein
MAGSAGIFWGFPEFGRSWMILTDLTSLAEAEPYGDFLTHHRGHYEVWTKWKKPRAAPIANQFILNAISEHEYETFPRGRIVYDTKKRRFILYADRRLQREQTIAAIADKFDLAPGTFDVCSDEHYRS